MQREDATPALSPASAGREHGTDLVQGQLAGASADHGSGVETGAPSTMHDVRLQGTGMERPLGLYRFSAAARANLQRWDARARTWFSDPSLARYEGMGGNWYDAEDISEEEALLIIVELNERAIR